MTEKIDKKYLKEAAKNLKRIYKKLGHSPTASEYNRITETQFKLRTLYKNNIKLNQLKDVAGIPKRKSGFKKGTNPSSRRSSIHCPAYGGKIVSSECMPGYKEEFCTGCKSKQKKNVKALPDIPAKAEKILKYDAPLGNKHMNGNDTYLTDVGVI